MPLVRSIGETSARRGAIDVGDESPERGDHVIRDAVGTHPGDGRGGAASRSEQSRTCERMRSAARSSGCDERLDIAMSRSPARSHDSLHEAHMDASPGVP